MIQEKNSILRSASEPGGVEPVACRVDCNDYLSARRTVPSRSALSSDTAAKDNAPYQHMHQQKVMERVSRIAGWLTESLSKYLGEYSAATKNEELSQCASILAGHAEMLEEFLCLFRDKLRCHCMWALCQVVVALVFATMTYGYHASTHAARLFELFAPLSFDRWRP